MKIRMLAGFSGIDYSLSPGDETGRFSAAEASRLIEAGFAVPVAAQKIERAVAAPVAETRTGAPVHDPRKAKPGKRK